MKTVDRIMVKDVVTASRDESIASVARKMGERNIGSVIVVEKRTVVGIVTERDLVRKVTCACKNPEHVKVNEIMTSKVITVTPETPIVEASNLLRNNKIKKLPVVEKGKLVGIVTETDITNVMREELLGIVPVLEESILEGGAKFDLKPGTVYLVKDENAKKSFDMFVDTVLKGVHGLCITRKNPGKVKLQYGLEKTPVIWLTNVATEHTSIMPNGIIELSMLVSKFLTDVEHCVILIDGIEYLITHNDYPQTLKMIQMLKDKVADGNSHLILSINHDTWDEKQLKLLESEMDIIVSDMKDIKQKLHSLEDN